MPRKTLLSCLWYAFHQAAQSLSQHADRFAPNSLFKRTFHYILSFKYLNNFYLSFFDLIITLAQRRNVVDIFLICFYEIFLSQFFIVKKKNRIILQSPHKLEDCFIKYQLLKAISTSSFMWQTVFNRINISIWATAHLPFP